MLADRSKEPSGKADPTETIAEARRRLRHDAQAEIRRCRKSGIDLLPLDDPDYPAALRQIHDPPVLLYRKGTFAPATVRVAMVGSRRATSYGRRMAGELAAGLAERGVEIVSGGARGIDSICHRQAMEAGGTTVAVLGSGMGNLYPPENRSLFSRICENGAMFSEFPLDFGPVPHNFPRRNRIISGISSLVLIIEAAARSGSLITAAHALDQGRDVLALPGPVNSALSAGCNNLIRDGACLVRSVEDIVAELIPQQRDSLRQAKEHKTGTGGWRGKAELSEDEQCIIGLLDQVEPIQIDELADRVPFGIGRLQVALFTLEVRGAVEQSPGRYYLLRPREES